MSAALAEQFVPDRRAYDRTPVEIFGRCLLNNGLEIPCQAINISPGDIAVIAGHSPKVGDHVVHYLDHIGRVEGPVLRVFDGGFASRIEGTPRKREKIAARIEWLKGRAEFGVEDIRRHQRIEPRQTNSQITMPDGRVYPVDIIDISLSGASVSCSVRPQPGTKLSLAGMSGHVVRHFPEGIAIEFENQMSLDRFNTFR